MHHSARDLAKAAVEAWLETVVRVQEFKLTVRDRMVEQSNSGDEAPAPSAPVALALAIEGAEARHQASYVRVLEVLSKPLPTSVFDEDGDPFCDFHDDDDGMPSVTTTNKYDGNAQRTTTFSTNGVAVSVPTPPDRVVSKPASRPQHAVVALDDFAVYDPRES